MSKNTRLQEVSTFCFSCFSKCNATFSIIASNTAEIMVRIHMESASGLKNVSMETAPFLSRNIKAVLKQINIASTFVNYHTNRRKYVCLPYVTTKTLSFRRDNGASGKSISSLIIAPNTPSNSPLLFL